MEKINKLNLPITIIIASIVLGGFYYVTQKNKQDSIERQQWIEQQAKKTQDDKEYAAKQKTACLGIYEAESKNWNNANGWRYDELKDTCYVEYKASPKLTKAECDAKYKGEDGKVPTFFFMEYLLCQDGLFEKPF
jgi:hypothetical protein